MRPESPYFFQFQNNFFITSDAYIEDNVLSPSLWTRFDNLPGFSYDGVIIDGIDV